MVRVSSLSFCDGVGLSIAVFWVANMREAWCKKKATLLTQLRTLRSLSLYLFYLSMHFADAEDAIREFHGTRLEGDRIIVRHHSYSSDSISNHHLV